MDNSLIFTGAAMAGAGTILYQLKAIPKQIFDKIKERMIYTVKVYQYDELFNILELWLAIHHQEQYRDVEASVNINTGYPEPSSDSKEMALIYKQEENTFILKYKGKRMVISKAKEKIDKAQNLKDIWFRKYSVMGWKAKDEIDCLLKEAIEFSKKEANKNSIRVSSNTSYGDWYTGCKVKIKPIEKTIINETKKSFIMSDLDSFLSSKDWYTDVCIPYKRGYCFYGPPGTGKTTLALAIANYTKRNVYCLNLNAIEDDSRLPKCFSDIPDGSVLLIEDIDRIFSGRDNVKEDSKITFSSLLNCLDGAFYKEGLITIITTNHLEKLDEALLRTGRIDVKMEVPKPSDREINKYYETFFNIPLYIEGHFDLKMSDVQEICLRNKLCPELAKQELIDKIIN